MRLVRGASVWSKGVAVKHGICMAMHVIDYLHKEFTGRDAEFTSIVDGKHHRNSLHYVGLACDLRIWYLGGLPEREQFHQLLRIDLGPDYDIVLKPDHLHTEFQPERRSII